VGNTLTVKNNIYDFQVGNTLTVEKIGKYLTRTKICKLVPSSTCTTANSYQFELNAIWRKTQELGLQVCSSI